MMRLRAAVLAAAAFVAAGPAPAQSGWGMIGQARAAPGESQASVAVRSTDPYRELMFCIEDAPMRLSGLTIRYQDGTTQTIGLRERLAVGRCSNGTSVRGRKAIAGVDISYDPATLAGATARLQVYGR